jgi:hypothetical protein
LIVTLRGYFSDDPGYVLRLYPDTGTSEIISAGGLLDSPWSIVEDRDGSLLVAEGDPAAILRIDPETGDQSVISEGGKLRSAYDLALSENGKIYVTGLDSQALEIDPATGLQRKLAQIGELRGIVVVPGDPTPPACSDGIDNDGDRKKDFPRDRGCSSPSDGTEEPPCSDGLDNDLDGLVDYPDDPGCESGEPVAQEAPQCNDGWDNDGDGWFDYPEDPECLAPHDNTEHWVPASLRSVLRRGRRASGLWSGRSRTPRVLRRGSGTPEALREAVIPVLPGRS